MRCPNCIRASIHGRRRQMIHTSVTHRLPPGKTKNGMTVRDVSQSGLQDTFATYMTGNTEKQPERLSIKSAKTRKIFKSQASERNLSPRLEESRNTKPCPKLKGHCDRTILFSGIQIMHSVCNAPHMFIRGSTTLLCVFRLCCLALPVCTPCKEKQKSNHVYRG
jgi:hypothetical protein